MINTEVPEDWICFQDDKGLILSNEVSLETKLYLSCSQNYS